MSGPGSLSSSSPLALLLASAAGLAAGLILSRTVLRPRLKKTAVKHVFFGKFKEGTTQEEIAALVEGYKGLTKHISSMKAFEWGTNVSEEQLDKGFTHVFVTTFDDPEGVDYYLKHEEHIKFAQQILGQLADVVVVDYNPNVHK